MAADIVKSVVDIVAPCLVKPLIRHLKYLFCFGTNIHNLDSAIIDLRSKRDAVQQEIDAKRGDEVPRLAVLNWLENVDAKDEQVKNTLVAGGNVKCANIKSRYVLSRKATEICKEISDLLREKTEFGSVVCPAPLVQLPFAAGRDLGVFESRMVTRKQVMEALRDSSTSVIGICGMAGVGKTVMAKEIADLVKEENVFDKVAMAVVSQSHEESKEQLINKIQNQLAEELEFSISEQNSLRARRKRVYTALQNLKDQKVLIILDDLWEDLDLQEIGIPTIDDCKGLKVLLTSRFSYVCKNIGAQKKNIFEVEVLNEEEAWNLFKETAGISDDDATNLVGVAKEVANQCAGLPLAIVIVAKALGNNKVEGVWSDALKQLNECCVTNIKGVHDKVYSRIEWSYNYLENDEAKPVLLLCSLFPEDFEIPIEVLVMYVKGLNLFRRTNTMKQTRDRMESVIHDLKDYYLLLNGQDENFVKMHDVVRDVCLIISSKQQLGYPLGYPLVSNYGTMEGPENRDNTPYTVASLTIGQLDHLLFDLDYSCLELLRMSYENWGEEELDLPVDTLQRVKSLKVLYLKKVNIRSPLPLQPLKSICSLFLHDCKLDRNVFKVSGLDNLQILSFLGCDLLEFPKGIENLGNLKSLNLMFKTCHDPLPKGVLPRLKKLEELYLEIYLKRTDGFDEQHAEEINSLSNLNVLVVSSKQRIISQDKVLKRLHLADMTRFYIGYWDLGEIFQFPRKFQKIMKVSDIDGAVLGDPNVGNILRKTECLQLVRAKGLRNVVPELEEDGFVNLMELKLEGGDYSEIIDATDSTNFFHNLQDLRLQNLNNLIEISNGKMGAEAFHNLQKVWLRNLPKMKYLWRQPPSLCNLTVLDVRECPEISYLFSQSILKCLVLLQQIDIHDCANLEEIVCKEETSTSTSGGTEILVLPKLQRWKIVRTNFTRFWNEDSGISSSSTSTATTQGNLQAMLNRVSLPDMTRLYIFDTNGPDYVIGSEMQIGSLHQLISIELWSCSNLKSFFVPLMTSHLAAQLLPSLEVIEIGRCESIQVLLDFEGMMKFTNNHGGESSSSSSKPKPVLLLFDGLQRIELSSLDGLKQIWRMPRFYGTTTTRSIYVIKAFQNLKTLSVFNCGSLRHLLSVSMAQMLVGLEELEIWNCDKMEEVIAAEAEEDDDITTNIELLPKLRSMILNSLPNLQVVFGIHNSTNTSLINNSDIHQLLLILPSLHQLTILNCRMLTKFCVGSKLSAPKLEKVEVHGLIPEDLKDREVIFVDIFGRKVEDPSTSSNER